MDPEQLAVSTIRSAVETLNTAIEIGSKFGIVVEVKHFDHYHVSTGVIRHITAEITKKL